MGGGERSLSGPLEPETLCLWALTWLMRSGGPERVRVTQQPRAHSVLNITPAQSESPSRSAWGLLRVFFSPHLSITLSLLTY